MTITKRETTTMNKRKLIKHLKSLGGGEIQPHHTTRGLCAELWHVGTNDILRYATRHLMTQWPKFSGDFNYPVPHPCMSPREAFNTMPHWRCDEYGNARRELCLWLAEYLTLSSS